MLANYPVGPTLPASDLQRAKRFYTEQLGLTPENEDEGGRYFHCGDGTQLYVFTSQGAPSGDHTQAGWMVPDVESAVAELKGRGVVFEEYDLPGMKTVNGIATVGSAKGAWFKDSDGNLLAITQSS